MNVTYKNPSLFNIRNVSMKVAYYMIVVLYNYYLIDIYVYIIFVATNHLESNGSVKFHFVANDWNNSAFLTGD